jgi:hypothetical protein
MTVKSGTGRGAFSLASHREMERLAEISELPRALEYPLACLARCLFQASP